MFSWQCPPVGRARHAHSTRASSASQVQKPPNLAKRGGCWFERGPLKIHLGVEADFRAARKAHPALLVEDLPGLKAAIEAAGFTPKSDEPLPGYERTYVEDPFGNRIELLERVTT